MSAPLGIKLQWVNDLHRVEFWGFVQCTCKIPFGYSSPRFVVNGAATFLAGAARAASRASVRKSKRTNSLLLFTRKGSSRSQTPLVSLLVCNKYFHCKTVRMVWPTIYDGKSEVNHAIYLRYNFQSYSLIGCYLDDIFAVAGFLLQVT